MNHPITKVHWDDRNSVAPAGYNEFHCDRKIPICQSFCGFYEMPARRLQGPAEMYNMTMRKQNLIDDSILKSSRAFWRIGMYHNDFGLYREGITDAHIENQHLMIPGPPHISVPDIKHFPRPVCNECQVDKATLNKSPWTATQDSDMNRPACRTCYVKPL